MKRYINIQGDPNEKKSLLDRSRSRSKYESIDSSSSNSDTAAAFLRKTTKFWVLPSNIHTVKKTILDKLPEFRFDGLPSKTVEDSGTCTNSVYFDSARFSVYKKRLRQEDMSQLYRYRWYSSKPAVKGFMEQKIRYPGWRGESSIKQRFDLNPENLETYINHGPASIEEARNEDLASKMFSDIKSWDSDLSPSLRTTYRRTCYQTSHISPLRVSFDEDVHLTCLRGLTYENCLDPSKKINSHLVFKFPLGILEVKQAFKSFEEMEMLELPDWVINLQENGLIIEVEKFSKYLTGVSVMHVDVLDEIPSWLQSVKMFLDIEIAKQGQKWLSESTTKQYIQFDQDISDVPLPKKIEPRTFMANERTLLKWIRMSFLALTVGLALIGLNHEPITGTILASFGLVLCLRTYYVYQRRLELIKLGDLHLNWEDRWSPRLLILMLVVPVSAYIIIKIGELV